MRVKSMMMLSKDLPHHTIFGMALAHLGQFGRSQLPGDVQLALGVCKAEYEIDTFHVTIPKRQQRGHLEHSHYIKERAHTIEVEMSEDEEEEKGATRPRQSTSDQMEESQE